MFDTTIFEALASEGIGIPLCQTHTLVASMHARILKLRATSLIEKQRSTLVLKSRLASTSLFDCQVSILDSLNSSILIEGNAIELESWRLSRRVKRDG